MSRMLVLQATIFILMALGFFFKKKKIISREGQKNITDLVIYLDTTVEISLARMKRRQDRTGTHADIHEKDPSYLEKCLHTADLACEYFGWHRISCLDGDGNERALDEKNDEIYALVRSVL